MSRLTAICAAAAICLALSLPQLAHGEPQQVEALAWKADSAEGLDCSKKAWSTESLNARSCGPFKVELSLSIDPKALLKGGKTLKLLSLGRTGAGNIEVDPNGFLTISRTGEKRGVGNERKATSAKPLPLDEGKPLCIAFRWNGKETQAIANDELMASFENIGTRNWCEFSIGPFPGRLHSVKLIAF